MNNNSRYEICRQKIINEIYAKIDLSREVSDLEIQSMIDDMVINYGRGYALSLTERNELGKSVFHSIRKMDILQELIECDDITEIMINGTDNSCYQSDAVLLDYQYMSLFPALCIPLHLDLPL